MTLECIGSSYTISLSGNSSLHIEDAPLVADSIRFHMDEEEVALELRGKAKMQYPDVGDMSADEITLDNDGNILLKGNAELRLTKPDGQMIQGKQIKIDSEGGVTVDDVDNGNVLID